MFFNNKKDYEKISFNCPKEIADMLEEMVEYSPTFEKRTDILKKSIVNEHKRFRKKIKRLENIKGEI